MLVIVVNAWSRNEVEMVNWHGIAYSIIAIVPSCEVQIRAVNVMKCQEVHNSN